MATSYPLTAAPPRTLKHWSRRPLGWIRRLVNAGPVGGDTEDEAGGGATDEAGGGATDDAGGSGEDRMYQTAHELEYTSNLGSGEMGDGSLV